jgi:hypothetical protein
MVFKSRTASVRRRRIALSRSGTPDQTAGSELDGDVASETDEWDEVEPASEDAFASVVAEPTNAFDLQPAAALLHMVVEPVVTAVNEAPILSTSSTGEFEQDWRPLLSLLARPRPLAWLFAGSRPGATESNSGSITGEEFGKCWRSASSRHTDVVIDATWPGASLGHLWSNISERVLRFRPDVAFLLLSDAESRAGMSQLSRFERQLEATITRLQKERILPVLIPCVASADAADIDGEVYAEAVLAIAKEREVLIPNGSCLDGRAGSIAQGICHLLMTITSDLAGAPCA